MLAAEAPRKIFAMDETIVPPATLKEMPDWFFCHICRMIMLHVYQLVCGHLVCAVCKEKYDFIELSCLNIYIFHREFCFLLQFVRPFLSSKHNSW